MLTSIVLQLSIYSLIFSANALQYCDKNCQMGDGYFCVKDDPTAFSNCLGGNRIATTYCSTGLMFDARQQACNWPSAIKGDQCPCSGPTTRAPTSPTPPTTRRTGPPPPTRPPPPSGLRRVCYFTNWSVYRQGAAGYTAGNVDPFMCTHIIIAFMNANSAQISYLEAGDVNTIQTLTKMRNEKNPSLKILTAIGGWNAGSSPFMEILGDPDTTQSFITQAISFLRQNDLDGLDIDWEYPSGQVAKYTQWMLDMRAAFENEAQMTGLNRLLLSAAVSAGASTIDWAYDVPKLSQAVDMINLMSYDLNGAWNPTTGLNSAVNSADQFNIQFASGYWIQKGADPSKLTVGIPTYGRTFKLCSPGPTQTGIGSKACGPGNPGPYTQSAGFEAYYESCLKLQCKTSGWTSVWDDLGQAPYMYSGTQWISYETPKSIAIKVEFVKSKNYGGVMVWAVDLDDFNDICGSGVRSPLMTTLVAAATNQPLPGFNSVPTPKVDPCDGSGGGGGGSDLDICDNKCANDGMYCMPNSPTQYYQCSNGHRYPPQTCLAGLAYNYVLGSCDFAADYPGCNCALSTSTTIATKTTQVPSTASLTTTQAPATTASTSTTSGMSSTTEASTETPTSTAQTQATTTPSDGSTPNLDICDKKCAQDGWYCVPNSPAQYYQCVRGRRYPLKSCSSGFAFNFLINNCDWLANYPGCNNCQPTNSTTPQAPSSSSTVTTPETQKPPLSTTATTRRRTTTRPSSVTTTPCDYCTGNQDNKSEI